MYWCENLWRQVYKWKKFSKWFEPQENIWNYFFPFKLLNSISWQRCGYLSLTLSPSHGYLGYFQFCKIFKWRYSEYLSTLYFVHVCKCFSNVDPWKQNRLTILKVFHFNFAWSCQFFYSILLSASRCTKTEKCPESVTSVISQQDPY